MNRADELAQSLRRGDEGAVSELYKELLNSSIGIAIQYVRTKEDAEDAYQEAFLKVMSAIDRYDETKPFQPWFNRILVNTCKDMLARKDNSAVVRFSDIDGEGATEDGDASRSFVDTLETTDVDTIPELSLDVQALKDIMNGILAELPDEQRQAVFLFYYQEMSVKGIAEYQKVSEDTVKSRLNYSRKKVRTAVEEYEKKHGIRLHSIAPIPLLLLFFKNDARACGMGAVATAGNAVAGGVAMPTGTATATATTAAGSAVASTGAGAGLITTLGIAAAAILGVGVGIGTGAIRENVRKTVSTPYSTVYEIEEQEDSAVVGGGTGSGQNAAAEEDDQANANGQGEGEENVDPHAPFAGMTTSEKLHAMGELPISTIELNGHSFVIGETTMREVLAVMPDCEIYELCFISDSPEGGIEVPEEILRYYPYLDPRDYSHYDENGELKDDYQVTIISELRYYQEQDATLGLSFIDLEGTNLPEEERVLFRIEISQGEDSDYSEDALEEKQEEKFVVDYVLDGKLTQDSPLKDWAAYLPELRHYSDMNANAAMYLDNTYWVEIWMNENGAPTVGDATAGLIRIGFGPDLYTPHPHYIVRNQFGEEIPLYRRIISENATVEELYDGPYDMPENVVLIKPRAQYVARGVESIREFTDSITGKEYYLVEFTTLEESVRNEEGRIYEHAAVLFEKNGYFYAQDDDGTYIYYFYEIPNFAEPMDLRLEIENPWRGSNFTWTGVAKSAYGYKDFMDQYMD